MGCDVHMYVEYKSKQSDTKYWKNFGGSMNPGRSYFLFGLMAKGVREDLDAGIELKGLPETVSYQADGDNKLFIDDSDPDSEGNCSLVNARQWEKQGSEIIYSNDKPTWVTDPDWHSHTWLSLDEFKTVMALYDLKHGRSPSQEYEALLSAMIKLSELGNEVRVVMWFDN